MKYTWTMFCLATLAGVVRADVVYENPTANGIPATAGVAIQSSAPVGLAQSFVMGGVSSSETRFAMNLWRDATVTSGIYRVKLLSNGGAELVDFGGGNIADLGTLTLNGSAYDPPTAKVFDLTTNTLTAGTTYRVSVESVDNLYWGLGFSAVAGTNTYAWNAGGSWTEQTYAVEGSTRTFGLVVEAVPEPGTLLLLGTAQVIALGVWWCRRQKQPQGAA